MSVLAEMFGRGPAGRLHRLPGRAARRDVCGAGPATTSRRGAGTCSPMPSLASSWRETGPSGCGRGRPRGPRAAPWCRRFPGSRSAVVRRGAGPAAAARGGRLAHGVLPDCHGESLVRSARAGNALRGTARARHAVGVRSRRHHGLGSVTRVARVERRGGCRRHDERRRREPRAARAPRCAAAGALGGGQESVRRPRTPRHLLARPRPARAAAAPTPLSRASFLAGDWTDTGLPGTIESAAMSGHRAAEHRCGIVAAAAFGV